MDRLRPMVAAHGGAQADPADTPEVQGACDAAWTVLQEQGPLEAAVAAVRMLEDSGRFNAGTGSLPRVDGHTLEADAACMAGDGRFGAVVALRGVRNPVLVARRVLDTPHNALAGEGALAFARRCGLDAPLVPSAQARATAEALRARLRTGDVMDTGWRLEGLRSMWNYPSPPPEACDTVGAVATDGRLFAAAASTGGLSLSLLGRVSDVPMVGGGLFAGAHGAVVLTGQGEYIARNLVSHRAYLALSSASPAQVAQQAADAAPPGVAAGLLVLGRDGVAAATNRTMPWAMRADP